MKILKGCVDWKVGCANRPELFLLVDAIPPLEALRFVVKDERDNHGGLYFAELRGYCQFFSYYGDNSNNRGFGGDKFNITMRDGEKRTLHGPWSSNSMTMNEHDFGPCIEACLTTSESVYIDRGPWNAGAVTLALLRSAADMIDVGTGYTWRSGAPYAAEVIFPVGSRFALACAGHVAVHSQHSRDSKFIARPEEFGDGTRIEDVQHAIRAALAASNSSRRGGSVIAREIAERYRRHVPPHDPLDALLSLTAYEPAVQFPDGEVWVKPASE